MSNHKQTLASSAPPPAASPAAATPSAKGATASQRMLLPPEVPQVYLPIRSPAPEKAQLVYQPRLLGYCKIYFADAKSAVDTAEAYSCLAKFDSTTADVNWQDAVAMDVPESDLEKQPKEGAVYATTPAAAGKAKNYDAWKKSLADCLYRSRRLSILFSDGLSEYSKAGESERDFRIRLAIGTRRTRRPGGQAARKICRKVSALQERVRKAQQAVAREAEQSTQAKLSSVISFGSTILGAFLSRKSISATNLGKAATAIKGASRKLTESSDVTRARENVAALEQQLADLDAKFQAEVKAVESRIDPQTEKFETMDIKPKKSDVKVGLMALGWAPFWTKGDDQAPAWK